MNDEGEKVQPVTPESDEARPQVRWIFAALALVLGVLGSFLAGRMSAMPAEDAQATSDTVYTCAMHPEVRSDEPGICPKCAMDLVPVSEAQEAGANTVSLSPRAAALARIRTTPVRAVSGAVGARRLSGRVRPDESRQRTVTSWINGRIDRLRVRTTGTRVGRGRVLATVYSPEVYAAHQDLLSTARQVQRLAGGNEAVRAAAEAGLEAARDRLRLLGIEGAELQALERADAPTRSVRIRSPFGGTVLERLVSEGEYVRAGTPLFKVADLGAVWVELDAYESDLSLLTPGVRVELAFEALPGRPVEGEVSFVDPVVDPRTGATHVRVEVPNAEGTLRPGMVAQGQLAVDVSDPSGEDTPTLMIPATAPLFTGRRAVVYVEVSEPGRPAYEARSVSLGPRIGEQFPVLAGLTEGEHVVTHGAFALDAEQQLRGGQGMMAQGDDTTRLEVSPALRDRLAVVVTEMLHLGAHLAADDETATERSVDALTSAVAEVSVTTEEPAVAEAWRALGLEDAVRRLGLGEGLDATRRALPAVQAAIEGLLRAFGNPTDGTVRVAECPMAFGPGESARWLQAGDTIANAYRGQEMLTCGSFEARVPPAGHLAGEPPPAGGHAGHTNAADETAETPTRPRRRATPAAERDDHAGHAGHGGHE